MTLNFWYFLHLLLIGFQGSTTMPVYAVMGPELKDPACQFSTLPTELHPQGTTFWGHLNSTVNTDSKWAMYFFSYWSSLWPWCEEGRRRQESLKGNALASSKWSWQRRCRWKGKMSSGCKMRFCHSPKEDLENMGSGAGRGERNSQKVLRVCYMAEKEVRGKD